MYTPKHFEETRADVLHEWMRANPLATLVTSTGGVLEANHIPILVDSGRGAFGTIRGHVARANPLWKDTPAGSAALAIFSSASSYISPAWYPSKQEGGRVVPTWNYLAVHAGGPIRFIEDPQWLLQLVSDLTDNFEAGRPGRWHVTDAPREYIDGMLAAIVGFEIEVATLSGKAKASQNRSEKDRWGVMEALEGEPAGTAAEMLRYMQATSR